MVSRFPVVGLGASAGGLAALQAFFRHVPENSGLAYVVVTHMPADRVSALPELIANHTAMPVLPAESGMKVVPDTVHVMPAGKVIEIRDGRLVLDVPQGGRPERKPVDIFLASLAEDQGDCAVAVILSGGDGDGTLGVKAVKEAGGLTLAQVADGRAPGNPHMPDSAISTGLIDICLPPEEMGPKLAALARGFGILNDMEDGQAAETLRQQCIEITTLLREQSGHDFSGYKSRSFLRRVRRRMQILQVEDVADYVVRLRGSPGEVAALFRDLLISVTAFFRDADAFDVLEKTAIPEILAGTGAGDTLRVWVPACATGEEVYSVAMLLCEGMDGLETKPEVRVFATDIDEAALGVARAGRYPGALMAGVSDARRKRFFDDDGEMCQISKEVRELCVFSPHSVLRDPPFSRMDLVSCRNLLIYLGSDTQRRLMPSFHYALKPGGWLFLGTSEGIGNAGHLFEAVDKRSRLYRSRGGRRSSTRGLDAMLPSAVSMPVAYRPVPSGRVPMRQEVQARVLDRYAPPHVVVDGAGDVVYFSARTAAYIEPPTGLPSRHLLSIARRGLRGDLAAVIRSVQESGRRAMKSGVVLAEEDGDAPPRHVTITAEPLAGTNPAQILILFSPAADPAEPSAESEVRLSETLEAELRDTRERLQVSIEEYETAFEELRAANEELVAVNEEAQSANEELEASQEEQQSLNEELGTINSELAGKVEALDRANSDLQNLFASSRVATLFLDTNRRIRNFTPAASSFFSLRDSDRGRPITDLANLFDYPDFDSDLDSVVSEGREIERQLPFDAQGRHYLARLFPYRDGGPDVSGIIVTFLDVTMMAKSEEQQKVLVSELNHRVKNILGVVIGIVRQTLRPQISIEDYHGILIDRLHALGRSYGLLSQRQWREVSLMQLVTRQLEAYGDEQVRLHGPDVQIMPTVSLALGMVLHELGTNAAKHGALSVPAGVVAVGWSLQGGDLHLTWTETGGPPAVRSDTGGFGLTLIEGQISYQLGGRFSADFTPAGLKVMIDVVLGGRSDG